MPECGKKCPAFYGIECNFNPDTTRRCELPHRVETTVSTLTPGMWEEPSV